jgi:hypothetical protein
MTSSSGPVRKGRGKRSEVTSIAPSHPSAITRGRLARPVELERTWTTDSEAMLAAPHGAERLDRFERALLFAMREASALTESKEDGQS